MLLYACTLGRNKCRFFAKEAVFYAWRGRGLVEKNWSYVL